MLLGGHRNPGLWSRWLSIPETLRGVGKANQSCFLLPRINQGQEASLLNQAKRRSSVQGWLAGLDFPRLHSWVLSGRQADSLRKIRDLACNLE